MDNSTLDSVKFSLLDRIPIFATKIAPIFVILNGRWGFDNDVIKVPNTEEIETKLKKLVNEFFKDYQNNLFDEVEFGFQEFGGLKVGFSIEEEDTIMFYMNLSIEENIFTDEIEEDLEE